MSQAVDLYQWRNLGGKGFQDQRIRRDIAKIDRNGSESTRMLMALEMPKLNCTDTKERLNQFGHWSGALFWSTAGFFGSSTDFLPEVVALGVDIVIPMNVDIGVPEREQVEIVLFYGLTALTGPDRFHVGG